MGSNLLERSKHNPIHVSQPSYRYFNFGQLLLEHISCTLLLFSVRECVCVLVFMLFLLLLLVFFYCLVISRIEQKYGIAFNWSGQWL